MDETYIRVRGQWRYLYRAVNSAHQTTHQNTESVLVVYPTHVMRIEPPSHSLFRMRVHVTPRKHERDDQQDRQPHYKASH